MTRRAAPQAHPSIPWTVELRTAIAAVAILYRRLGWRRTISVLARMGRLRWRGEPFSQLPRATHRREQLCRQQLGPAILLHRALLARLPAATARDVIEQIVIQGALIFLRHTIGPAAKELFRDASESERSQLARAIGARFFNATIEWKEISAQRVCFVVTHCRFSELCRTVGAEELGPLFCRGDGIFFEQVLGEIQLVRPHTIAEGAATCPFELLWTGAPLADASNGTATSGPANGKV